MDAIARLLDGNDEVSRVRQTATTQPGRSWPAGPTFSAAAPRPAWRMYRRSAATAQPGSPADYLVGAYGRLRTVVAGPDGALWLTTSNKDGAGKPTPQDDRVIRIMPPAGSTNSPA